MKAGLRILIIKLLLVGVVLPVAGQVARGPREIYERARMLDESNQNLTEDIRLYSQVTSNAKDNRPLAAKAQYRIGALYERLGRKAQA